MRERDRSRIAGTWHGLLRYLRRHPILVLFLMTPGIPEYLSGSSSFVSLIVNPAWFFLALGINAAMYTVGALVIREVVLLWNKGWPTVFALGAAYSIMEEGIADQTLFNPSYSPLGPPGLYGRFLGINWLWAPDVFVIHILLSISLPLLLLGYALPETRGRRLLSDRGIWSGVVLLAGDTAFLTALVVTSQHYWYGLLLLLVSVAGIVGLCALGYFLPKYVLPVPKGPPTGSRLQFFLVGCVAYPLMALLADVGSGRGFPPVLVFLAICGEVLLLAAWFLRHIGSEENERHLLAFTVGTLMILFFLGVFLEFPFEIVVVADLAAAYFLYSLDRSFREGASFGVPRPA
jgi:hypothetical protein